MTVVTTGREPDMPRWMLDTSNLGFWAFWHFIGTGLVVAAVATAAGAVARAVEAIRGRDRDGLTAS